jgi:arginyl-tRNA synthetase
MKTYIQELITTTIKDLQNSGKLAKDLKVNVQIDRTRDITHGDYASNIALTLAKQANLKPRELAELLIANLPPATHITKTEIAGPGFINFFISQNAQYEIINEILDKKAKFGLTNIGQDKKVHIEYVSANPTGPLHVGHGRGAVYGSAVADLLAAVGYQVHREYYVNDGGRQMDILTLSLWLRYLEQLGEKISFPTNAYQGDYILPIAAELKAKYNNRLQKQMPTDFPKQPKADCIPDAMEIYLDEFIASAKKLLGEDYKIVHAFAKDKILQDIKEDLEEFGVSFQEWFSENSMKEKGEIKSGIEALKKGGYLYEKDGALWFRSTKFGDEKDRVLVRANGQTTYFASDVAYHWDKLQRGFETIIDIFGADHHGYIARVRAAMEAMGLDHNALHVPLVQFAILYRGGKRVQMSTRSGEFITLRQLREEIGKDAARFFYVMRKPEQHLDFDLDLAKSKTNENPVYYIQYAHARICSVFRQLKDKNLKFDEKTGLHNLATLNNTYEKSILTCLARYPEIIINAATNLEPHQLVNYLRELANLFHTYYNAEQFIVTDELLRNARLCLIESIRQIIKNGLNLLGISAPESM